MARKAVIEQRVTAGEGTVTGTMMARVQVKMVMMIKIRADVH